MARVLVAAYACNPLRGSEEAVGWNFVRSIAADHETTVITAAFHRPDIEAVCGRCPNPRFVFVEHQPWHYAPTTLWKRIEGSIAKPIMNLAYAAWQRDAFHLARTLAQRERFDLVHQLTYVGFRFPGHLWRLGLPFVWGPIGGLENTPWRLLPAMGVGGAIYHAGRNLVNSAQRRWLSSPRRAAAVAGPGLIAATGGIARELKQLYGVDSTIVSEVVAPLALSPEQPRRRNGNEALRLVWSGQHLPGKALNLLLEALARLYSSRRFELHVLGDGPRNAAWRRRAAELSLADRCIWHGMVPRARALDIMREAHVLVITSLKDLTSTVLLEGLALGLPVVCPDHCGFVEVVTPNCGIKVPTDTPANLIRGLAAALRDLESDEGLRRRLADGALERARAFGPEGNRRRLTSVYDAVLNGRECA
ncbi:glycosyltransferase family 4 protein [Jiella sp. MQZ9-1]|uniref:Glycosyltransferase family 4 protein n=1 Tax=Jiella flava TaxID=2816857 RepID=A0A939FYQ7_9HYPH|nr:glycosyltransferase family 4 protein [Jiella flava]MBO0662458.1 glycosyltransferase family 4 protein [Jiella flava]MCD2471683.1 glycosyltransferase family 4 protein [Jiella flava]